jgi:ABC-type polysaccharide transport system permease subunit
MINLCAPALIYVAFSLTQIIIDTFKGLYNTAFLKIFVMIIITILLNSLCQAGMGIISWVIVFIPFIFMTIIVAILLYVFGLDPSTGKLNVTCHNCNVDNTKTGNLIYRSTIDHDDVYKIDTTNDYVVDNNTTNAEIAPFWSSDPQYD